MSRNTIKIKGDILEVMFISILFLFSLNFMNRSNYIYVALIFIAGVYMYKKNIKISLTSEFFILTICFTSYFLIYANYFYVSLQSFITYWIGPISGYFIGYHIINKRGNIDSNKVNFAIVWGLFIHGMLNMILFISGGNNGRVIPDIWLGIGILATLQGTFFTLISGLLFYSLYITKSILNKIILIVAILFSIYSTLQTASRTLLIIVIITLLVNIAIYIFLNKIKLNTLLNIIIKIILSGLVITICYTSNLLQIKDIYENSQLYKRVNSEHQLSLQEDGRFEMYKEVSKEMFNYPMGGDKMPVIGYAHNLWLDTAKMVGIIPFFLLLIYTIMTILTLLKFIKNKYIQDEKKYLITSIYISMTLNFMVEPILEGVPYMFIMMCIINGSTRYILDSTKRRF